MAQRRGDAAKQYVSDTIINAFGNQFTTIADKKIYVDVPDGPGGEIIQIAIAMTMPKVPVAKPAGGTPTSATTQAPSKIPTELSSEDKEAVARLMAQLGISD